MFVHQCKFVFVFCVNFLAFVKTFELKHDIMTRGKILFTSPANDQQELQINSQTEDIFVNKILRGWLLEADKTHSINMFMQVDTQQTSTNNNQTAAKKKLKKFLSSTINSMHFYMYLTLNESSCVDYMRHTHIPIILTESNRYKRQKNLFKVTVDVSLEFSPRPYYVCLSDLIENLIDIIELHENDSIAFHHQGRASEVSFLTYKSLLSTQFKICIYVFMVVLNSIFNGLNIGLMSLSVKDLEVMIKTTHSEKQRKHAEYILPLRKKGNYLLCSILLSITMTSSVSVLLLEDLVEGLLAGIFSTIILCIFGEIIPQSVCTRYSLQISSQTRKLTYFFIYLTSILSFPLSKIVDYVLGQELPIKYNREAVKELIKKSIDLKEKECNIINGALDLKNKHISDIIVDLDNVFMVEANERLNFENIAMIYNSGYSRIPVYEKTRSNVVGLFHVKDLALIDSSDEMVVKSLLSIYKHNVVFCYKTDRLLEIFDTFCKGSTHMAFVIEHVQDEDTDPYEVCIGIVTLNDIIECLLQLNLSDELTALNKSAFGMNYLKKLIDNQKRKSMHKNKSWTNFNQSADNLSTSPILPKISSTKPKIPLQTKYLLSQILISKLVLP